MSKDEFVVVTQRMLGAQEVPPNKWVRMLQRTLIGSVLIASALAGAALWEWPWWVVVPMLVTGGTVWSTQVVLGAIRPLMEPLREIMGIVRGSGGRAP